MLHDGVSLIPVLVVIILLNLLFLQLMFFNHELAVLKQMQCSKCTVLVVGPYPARDSVPVWILNDAPVDPLLQDFKVRDAGCFSQIQTQLLGLAVTSVVEGSVMEKAQRRPTHTLSFVY